MILLIFVLNCFFDKLYVTKKNYQMVEKNQLLIILPFLGQLYSCIRNQLPYCSLRIAFQSKTCLSKLFKFKQSIPKYLCFHLIYKFSCSCCNASYYGETERQLFVRASEHLGITPLTKKRVKNSQKSTIIGNILLQSHNATYNGFLIFIPEKSQFKLHLKELLLIKRLELYRNIYTHPLKLVG